MHNFIPASSIVDMFQAATGRSIGVISTWDFDQQMAINGNNWQISMRKALLWGSIFTDYKPPCQFRFLSS
jgi:hypothetical protein